MQIHMQIGKRLSGHQVGLFLAYSELGTESLLYLNSGTSPPWEKSWPKVLNNLPLDSAQPPTNNIRLSELYQKVYLEIYLFSKFSHG